MDSRYFHGNIAPNQIGQALVARFDHGNLRAQQIGVGDKIVVQIATREFRASGGQTALSVHIAPIEDGISVQIGEQDWLGIAASLGQTIISGLFNPLAVISRLDDLAQDINSLSLTDAVWEEIENVARSAGASFELSERLKRIVCEYCQTANPPAEPSCIACGAPLGGSQLQTCKKCGYVVKGDEERCPQCGNPLVQANNR
jgi:hypothetical protein